MLVLLAETLTSQLKVMIAGTVLAVIGLTDIIIFLFLFFLSVIINIITIMLKLKGLLLNYVQACLFLMQLRSMYDDRQSMTRFYFEKTKVNIN